MRRQEKSSAPKKKLNTPSEDESHLLVQILSILNDLQMALNARVRVRCVLQLRAVLLGEYEAIAVESIETVAQVSTVMLVAQNLSKLL